MELNDFIGNFADLFEDIDPAVVTADCKFQELEEWDSLTALGIIGMARTEYGKSVTGREIRSCSTILDLFNLINSK